MKKLTLLTLLALGLAPMAFAEEKKIEGEAVCAKCELHQSDTCRAAIQVKGADGKTTTYLTEPNDKAKALHKEICKGGKEVTVEGTVTGDTIKITQYKVK